jgi:hypothetical protein
LKQLAKVVDGLTGIFGRGTRFGAQIENRVGSLLLSSHFLTSGKVEMSGTSWQTINVWNWIPNVVGQISFY